MLLVEVEATSANVCVGFDVLGLALNLTNKFTFDIKDDFSFKGFEEEFSKKETNLVYESYIKYFKKVKMTPIPVEIGFEGDIPVSRGLGSSSSLIVAGIFAANKLAGDILSKNELFDLCAELEGHPDNVAPAIYGSLVASYKKGDSFIPNIYKVNKDLKFIVVIPPFKLSTHEARGVLPTSYTRSDIVSNLSRIINIPKAFENGDIDLLCDLFEDKIHEPYRSQLIRKYDDIKAICKKNNVAFAISGSGSTMLIISKDTKIVDELKPIGYETKVLQIGSGVSIKEV